MGPNSKSKEKSSDIKGIDYISSYFAHAQNYLFIEGNPKKVVQ